MTQLSIKNCYLLKASCYRQIIILLLRLEKTQANRYLLQNKYLWLLIKKVSKVML